jgi:hypothetical protein
MQALRTKTRAIMIVVVVVFVLSIFTMYLTGSSRSSRKSPEGDVPVASVGGQKIMASQIMAGVQDFAEQSGQTDFSPESIVEMRKNVLNSIAMQHMLQKEASRLKIKAPEDEIDMAIKRIENQFPTKEAFQQYMESRDIRMKDLREQIGMQLAQRMVLDAGAGDVEVGEEEAREFYDQTKELFFRQPEGFNVMFARFMSLEVAEKARQELLDGSSWDDVVKKYEDVTIDFTVSSEPAFVTAKEFSEGSLKALNATPQGKVSEPLELSKTDVVVLVKEKKLAERIVPYEEASADVRSMISEQKKQVKQNEYLETLLAGADIRMLDQEFFEVPAEPEDNAAAGDAEGTEEGKDPKGE